MCASHHKKIFSCTTGSGRDSGYIVEGIHVAVVLGCRGGAIHLTSIFLRERQRGKVETAMCVCVRNVPPPSFRSSVSWQRPQSCQLSGAKAAFAVWGCVYIYIVSIIIYIYDL